MISQKCFGQLRIDLSLVFIHQLIPTNMTGIGAYAHILDVEICFLFHQLFIDWKIGTGEVAIFRPLQVDVLQS